jgi:hypothetical protein
MIYQIVITWDDISAGSALTSLTPVTVNKTINLYDGIYKAEIVGFNFVDTKDKANSATSNLLINLNSSRFSFPAQAQQGLFFSNRMDHVQTDLNKPRELIVNNVGGNLDLSMSVQQFNVNRTKNNAATWNDTGFNFLILTLDLEKC